MKILLIAFDGQPIWRRYGVAIATWWSSVVDVALVLSSQLDYLMARKHWNQLRLRLVKEGSQLVKNRHQLRILDVRDRYVPGHQPLLLQ